MKLAKKTRPVCLSMLLSLLLFTSGCGLTEGTIQKAPKSLLWFTGNTANALVYIDDLPPIQLGGENAVQPGDTIHSTDDTPIYYEISPGKHTLIVIVAGQERVNRRLLLGAGMTTEVNIP